MKTTAGATPLAALDGVAIDTETTSLDTSLARIVEIGAVALKDGAAFETLVDPGIAIPQRSSAVHGITDSQIAGAPRFMKAWNDFSTFAAGRVLIGYSIGYDLAILEREAERAGIPWIRPRTLCIRVLAALANSNLPDASLDMIAVWLGVDIKGRHRAPGDARAAADIFQALLPRLQERGIRTLAEAERASAAMTQQLESHQRAGWSDPVTRPAASPGPAALRAIDPFAYRHRVGDIMSAPPIVVSAATTTRDVIALMVERRVSSVLVAEDGAAGRPVADYGIVTERDMMRRMAADGAAAFEAEVGAFASRPLASIRAAAFVYRAMGRMGRLRIRHLAVRDEAGGLVGIVSARDLLKLRGGSAINLNDAIEDARSAEDMAAAWALLPSVAEALIGEGIDARLIAGVVSEELRAMTRRAAVLAERAMEGKGLGGPPSPFAVLVLGSGGRGESLMAADQDNAIVFAEGDPDGPQDRWFAAMAEEMAAILDGAGIPFCKGGVMAKNPLWRGSLATWHTRIADWINRSRPEDLLNVDIFFDLMPVHGELSLGQTLFDQAYAAGHAQKLFAKLLGEQVASLSSPFTLFGGLQTEDGRIDLKRFGLFPIVAAARTLSIRHDVRARSTRERLEGLIALGIGGEADMTAILQGHALILSLMLAQQSADLHSGIKVSNRVETAGLSRTQAAALKAALKQVQIVPDLVRDLMFGTAG